MVSEPLHTDGGSRPVPDPTELTSKAVDALRRELIELFTKELEIRDERLRGIDSATELRIRTIERIPGDVVRHERELTEQQFLAVAQRFDGLETRSEKVESLNKIALDAAFAAQKEAAAKQDEANQKAIDKSEKATSETLNKQADLFKSTTDALADKIEDLRARLGMIDATLVGLIQKGAGGRDATTDNRANILAAVTVIVAVMAIIGFVITNVIKP